MDHVLKFACDLTGKSRDVTHVWDFTGRDYCMMLSAISSDCIQMQQVCWSLKPIRMQLESNLLLFLKGAAAADAAGVAPFPDDVTVDNLAPLPMNAPHHVAVLSWIFELGCEFPPALEYDAIEVLKTHFIVPAMATAAHGPTPNLLLREEYDRAETKLDSLQSYFSAYRAELLTMIQHAELDYTALSKIQPEGSSIMA